LISINKIRMLIIGLKHVNSLLLLFSFFRAQELFCNVDNGHINYGISYR
jgi:hypothetical protein